MSPEGGNPAVLYSAYVSGVDRAFILGGVHRLAVAAQPLDLGLQLGQVASQRRSGPPQACQLCRSGAT